MNDANINDYTVVRIKRSADELRALLIGAGYTEDDEVVRSLNGVYDTVDVLGNRQRDVAVKYAALRDALVRMGYTEEPGGLLDLFDSAYWRVGVYRGKGVTDLPKGYVERLQKSKGIIND